MQGYGYYITVILLVNISLTNFKSLNGLLTKIVNQFSYVFESFIIFRFSS